MTTPPWCREKVMVYYIIIIINFFFIMCAEEVYIVHNAHCMFMTVEHSLSTL